MWPHEYFPRRRRQSRWKLALLTALVLAVISTAFVLIGRGL